MKSQGKPGIVREFSINCYPSQGTVRENKSISPHIIFINSFHGFCMWLFNLLSANVSFITLHGATVSTCT